MSRFGRYPGDSRKGASGNATRAWQDRLIADGFLTGPSNGEHGPEMEEAIRNLREAVGYDGSKDEFKTGGNEALWARWEGRELAEVPEAVDLPGGDGSPDGGPPEGDSA